ncbi:MAG: hypothetical protein AB7Q17_01700 [Phycisphaerae bacterium]
MPVQQLIVVLEGVSIANECDFDSLAGNTSGGPLELHLSGSINSGVTIFASTMHLTRSTIPGNLAGRLDVWDIFPTSGQTLTIGGNGSGQLNVGRDFAAGAGNAGTILVSGSVPSGGRVRIGRNTGGAATIQVNGSAAGEVSVGNEHRSGAVIRLNSGLAGGGQVLVDGPLLGKVSITGTTNGLVRAAQELAASGLIELTGDFGATGVVRVLGSIAGRVAVSGGASGSIETGASSAGSVISVGGNLTGAVKVTGNLAGQIRINGSLPASGASPRIEVTDTRAASGAIAVDYDGWDSGHDWNAAATISVSSTTYTLNTPAARVWEIQPCRGDMNNDGLVNNFDIDPFVQALGSPASYQADYPGLGNPANASDGSAVYHGDANCDGAFNNFDIDPFVALIAGECCEPTCAACGGDSFVGPQWAAELLFTNTAAERLADLSALVSAVAADEIDAQRAAFWSEVAAELAAY